MRLTDWTGLARRVALALALGLALGLPGGLASAAPFTDSAARTVEVPDRVSRVFAAGPPAAAFLYTLVPEKMAGWVQRPAEAAMPFIAAPYRGLPESGRLTSRRPSATADTVIAFCPDIVVDVGNVDRNYAYLADRIGRAARVPYLLLGDTLAGTGDSYRTLGRLLGAAERGAMLGDRADRIVADARGRAGAAPVRVLVVGGPAAEPMALDGELAALAGVEDVAAQGMAGNPAIVLATDDAALAKVRAAAAPSLRVVRVPAQPFGWLGHPPGPNCLVGLHWLSGLVAGQPPAGQAAFLRDFYHDFYGVDLTQGQVDGLLGL